MADDVFSAIGSYYDRLVDRFGHDPRACDYGRPESQHTKFRVLSAVMPLADRSVLDVGCGFADFADFLRQEHGGLVYRGIDLSAAMIARARMLHPDLDLRQASVLDLPAEAGADVVFANGIFYLLGDGAPELMQRIITKMFTLARHAVAFNALSTWAPDPEASEFYADPLETVQFCRTLSPWVTLRQDYHHRDFTVYLYREQRQS